MTAPMRDDEIEALLTKWEQLEKSPVTGLMCGVPQKIERIGDRMAAAIRQLRSARKIAASIGGQPAGEVDFSVAWEWAAAELGRLRAANTRLREALLPLATYNRVTDADIQRGQQALATSI